MSQHLGWDMKSSICSYKNNRGVQNWVGWGYYYYTTTLGRAANLLKLKFTCGFYTYSGLSTQKESEVGFM